jgi:LPS-assembly protein
VKNHKTTRLLLLFSLFLPVRAASPELLSESRDLALCKPDPALPQRPEIGDRAYQPGYLYMEADEAEAIEDRGATLRGGVELIRDQQALRTDVLIYDKPKNTVNIQGNAQFWDKAVFLSGPRGLWDLGTNVAQFEAGEYRLLERRGHGQAGIIKSFSQEDLTRLEEVDYTTCDEEPAVWGLAAKYLKLDHAEERGQATHVTLQVKDIPVFYWPYLSFPLSDKRKSGFLTPKIGYSSKSGADVSVPYYWNIAPEYDATLIPRFLSKRGVMLGGELRYLLRSGRGQLNLEYLPSDSASKDNNDRSLFVLNHQQGFAEGRGHVYLSYAHASDNRYLEDFGTSLSLTSQIFLEQRADIAYGGSFWNLLGRVQGYQSMDPTLIGVNKPYERLPQIVFQAYLPGGFRGLQLQFQAEAVNFDRDADPTGGRNPIGERIDLKPSVSLPLHTRAAFLIPKLSLRHTQYLLDNTSPEIPEEISRTVPIFSLDSGLFMERDFEFGGAAYLQTLEPRLFYLYIPDRDQNAIPLFDTNRYDVSFFRLFREDRFSGPDRVGDANQVTLALTSRFINRDSGLEHLRASLGQIIYFEDRNVTLPRLTTSGTLVLSGPPNTDALSETVAEINARLLSAWNLRGNLTWDPNSSKVQKGTLGVRYWPDPYTVFNAEYRLRQDVPNSLGKIEDLKQTDVSFRWPLTPKWSLVGRWNYSLNTDKTLETVGGIEYNSCCWGLSAVARRYLSRAADLSSEIGRYDTAFYVQLELKGLAGLGRSTTSFLKRSIPGYQNEF